MPILPRPLPKPETEHRVHRLKNRGPRSYFCNSTQRETDSEGEEELKRKRPLVRSMSSSPFVHILPCLLPFLCTLTIFTVLEWKLKKVFDECIVLVNCHMCLVYFKFPCKLVAWSATWHWLIFSTRLKQQYRAALTSSFKRKLWKSHRELLANISDMFKQTLINREKHSRGKLLSC